MKRLAIFAYGLVCYAVFFATFLYAVGFIGNLWVPKSIDSPRDVALGTALAGESRIAGPVRRAAQRHGAAGLQALVDPHRAGAGGAQHLRAVLSHSR